MTSASRPATLPSPPAPVGPPSASVAQPSGRAAVPRGRLLLFWRSAIGKKIVMAVTGLMWIGFLVVHMSGNLLAFGGSESLNHYARLLRTIPELLWIARGGLIAALALHVIAAVQLTQISRFARPAGYTRRDSQVSTFASRTIRWGGLFIFVFLIFHILHMTLGTVHPQFQELRPYENVVNGFGGHPVVAAFYALMMIVVGLHLYHGTWSAVRSLGAARPQREPLKRRIALGLAVVIWLGFTVVPVGVLLGVLR